MTAKNWNLLCMCVFKLDWLDSCRMNALILFHYDIEDSIFGFDCRLLDPRLIA
jgi:hypothetical protein